MHQSDKRRLVYYHPRYDEIMIVTSVKSDTTMKFALLSLFGHDLDDCSEPVVLGSLVNIIHR